MEIASGDVMVFHREIGGAVSAEPWEVLLASRRDVPLDHLEYERILARHMLIGASGCPPPVADGVVGIVPFSWDVMTLRGMLMMMRLSNDQLAMLQHYIEWMDSRRRESPAMKAQRELEQWRTSDAACLARTVR